MTMNYKFLRNILGASFILGIFLLSAPQMAQAAGKPAGSYCSPTAQNECDSDLHLACTAVPPGSTNFLCEPVKFCWCGTDLDQISGDYTVDIRDTQKVNDLCLPSPILESACNDATYSQIMPETISTTCFTDVMQGDCKAREAKWGKQYQTIYDQRKKGFYDANVQGGFEGKGFIPNCVLQNDLQADCKDVSILVALVINVARWFMGAIGAWALIFFIYGGFTLILSAGNAERVKKGTDTIMASLVGIFIAFVAYMAVKYMGEALNIKDIFRLY